MIQKQIIEQLKAIFNACYGVKATLFSGSVEKKTPKTNSDAEMSKKDTTSSLATTFQQNYFGNFRDVSKFNPKLKKGLIFRSAALCLFQHSEQFYDLIEKNNMKTIIDLRANRELAELNYESTEKVQFNVVHAPFDPWEQSTAFKNTYNKGTNVEIAYHFFTHECKESIKTVMQTLL